MSEKDILFLTFYIVFRAYWRKINNLKINSLADLFILKYIYIYIYINIYIYIYIYIYILNTSILRNYFTLLYNYDPLTTFLAFPPDNSAHDQKL